MNFYLESYDVSMCELKQYINETQKEVFENERKNWNCIDQILIEKVTEIWEKFRQEKLFWKKNKNFDGIGDKSQMQECDNRRR